jgi:hypothetical protein
MSGDEQTADEASLLLEFVRDRDVPCPRCGYNLRNLSAVACPECRETLALQVGFLKPRFGWLLATVIPGFFSGICAALLAVPMVGSLFFSANSPAPWPVWAVDAFGWLSGLSALILVKHRYAFLRQPQATQRLWAGIVWLVHLFAFAALVLGSFLSQ